MSVTLERIFSLIKESGKSEYAIKKETGLKNSTFSEWRAGRANPSTEAIVKLANYFNVSADYLLCLTDTPTSLNLEQENRSLPAERPETALTTEMHDLFKEQRFINTAKIYNELPDEYREKAYGLIMGIAIGIGLNVDKILGR